jgi:hypothetical protein
MSDTPKDDETIDEKKMDGLLKKMLSTPHKPHKPKSERQPAEKATKPPKA